MVQLLNWVCSSIPGRMWECLFPNILPDCFSAIPHLPLYPLNLHTPPRIISSDILNAGISFLWSSQFCVLNGPLSPTLLLQCPANSLTSNMESSALTQTNSLWVIVQISPQSVHQLSPLGDREETKTRGGDLIPGDGTTEAQTGELLGAASGLL